MSDNKNKNPMQNDIVAKAVVAIFAAALSISVPLVVSRLDGADTDTQQSSQTVVSDNGDKLTDISENVEVSENAESKTQISEVSENAESKTEIPEVSGYYMADISHLENVDYFAKGTLEHIFDGTINKKGNATGYHYTMVLDSKGKIIDGTRSKEDKNGVFTGKVEVDGVQKNGFSSFYPESWTPQQVVDAVNTAYEEATANPDNPKNSLWIGHYGDIEIDMYLNDSQQITTAYPVYQK